MFLLRSNYDESVKCQNSVIPAKESVAKMQNAAIRFSLSSAMAFCSFNNDTNGRGKHRSHDDVKISLDIKGKHHR